MKKIRVLAIGIVLLMSGITIGVSENAEAMEESYEVNDQELPIFDKDIDTPYKEVLKSTMGKLDFSKIKYELPEFVSNEMIIKFKDYNVWG